MGKMERGHKKRKCDERIKSSVWVVRTILRGIDAPG